MQTEIYSKGENVLEARECQINLPPGNTCIIDLCPWYASRVCARVEGGEGWVGKGATLQPTTQLV